MACNNKIHSRGRVDFSRENKAAVALPHRRRNGDDPVQNWLRSLPRTSARKAGYIKLVKDGGVEDPFLAAYRDCAIEVDEIKNYQLQKNKNGFGGLRNLFETLSCKQLTAVRDDSLISSPVSKRTVYRLEVETTNPQTTTKL